MQIKPARNRGPARAGGTVRLRKRAEFTPVKPEQDRHTRPDARLSREQALQDGRNALARQGCPVVSIVNTSLLSYLTAQGSDGSTTSGQATSAQQPGNAGAVSVSPAALQRAAAATKTAAAGRTLEASQKSLANDLRAAMGKAGVKLSGSVEFSIKSDGSVDIKASDADKAATQAFLRADTSQPGFASRIATQARDALKLSSTIQQSAAISQAARLAKTSSGVISLYTSLMQQAGTAGVAFTVSASSSSLTYPGSLTAKA
jgi:hypothetical protein